MKKWILFLAIAIAASLWIFVIQKKTERHFNSSSLTIQGNLVPSFGQGRSGRGIAAAMKVSGRTSLEVARNFVELHRAEWKLQSHHELVPEVYRSPLGSRVKFAIVQDGIPIIGLALEVRMNRNLEVVGFENEYKPLEKADLSSPTLSVSEVFQGASARLHLEPAPGSEDHVGKILFPVAGAPAPQLAYAVSMKDPEGKARLYQMVFRAADGQVLAKQQSRTELR